MIDFKNFFSNASLMSNWSLIGWSISFNPVFNLINISVWNLCRKLIMDQTTNIAWRIRDILSNSVRDSSWNTNSKYKSTKKQKQIILQELIK